VIHWALVPLVVTYVWYLGCAAEITYPVRSRLPLKVQSFLACPACAGFWYGLILGIVAWGWRGIWAGLTCGILTPLLGALLLWALDYVSSTFSKAQELN
jgi:hypothetical protein